mgnify:CR=1 FL=1
MKDETSKIYGLVLAGGQSRRMKALRLRSGQAEKAALCYHGMPQVQYGFKLLAAFCAKAFVSVRNDQKDLSEFRRYPQIHDLFESEGPIIGMLSAMKTYPQAAWIVLACDLPYVEEKTIAALVEQRNVSKIATAFRSPDNELPEPLCAIYEPQSQKALLEALVSGHRSPQKTLANSDIELITPSNPRWLQNVNSPEEYERAMAELRGGW